MSAHDIQEPIALLREGKAGEAIPLLERLLQVSPGHVTCYVLLARAYAAEQRWSDSLALWQQAAFLMPNGPAILEGLDEALRQAIVAAPDPAPPTAVPDPEEAVLAETEQAWLPDPEEAGPSIEEPMAPPADPPASVPFFDDPDEPPVDRFDEAMSATTPPANGSLSHAAAPDDELDRLITDLESARIVPRPDYETIEKPDLNTGIDDVVSETLARIYEGQKQYDEAARMYDKLAILKPDRADLFTRKAFELRTRANSE